MRDNTYSRVGEGFYTTVGDGSRSCSGRLIELSVDSTIDNFVCDCTWGYTRIVGRSVCMSLENRVRRLIISDKVLNISTKVKKSAMRSLC